MIKFSRTIINPPDGLGPEIKTIDIFYYYTEDPKRKEYNKFFRVGQRWSRKDDNFYEIKDMVLAFKKNGKTQLMATLKKVDSPQMIRTELTTLIKFWNLNLTPAEGQLIQDKRFEIIE